MGTTFRCIVVHRMRRWKKERRCCLAGTADEVGVARQGCSAGAKTVQRHHLTRRSSSSSSFSFSSPTNNHHTTHDASHSALHIPFCASPSTADRLLSVLMTTSQLCGSNLPPSAPPRRQPRTALTKPKTDSRPQRSPRHRCIMHVAAPLPLFTCSSGPSTWQIRPNSQAFQAFPPPCRGAPCLLFNICSPP